MQNHLDNLKTATSKRMCTETPTAFVGVMNDTKLGLNSTAKTVYITSIMIRKMDMSLTPSM